jgi:hypothetical protein
MLPVTNEGILERINFSIEDDFTSPSNVKCLSALKTTKQGNFSKENRCLKKDMYELSTYPTFTKCSNLFITLFISGTHAFVCDDAALLFRLKIT